MRMTLSRSVRLVAERRLAASDVERALVAMGSLAEADLSTVAPIERARIVGRFVRQIRGLSIRLVHELEALLRSELEAMPRGELTLAVDKPFALLKARNHVADVAQTIDLDWNATMRLQAAMGEAMRQGLKLGGAVLSTRCSKEQASFELRFGRGTNGDLDQMPWIDQLESMVASLDSLDTPEGLTVRFTIGSNGTSEGTTNAERA